MRYNFNWNPSSFPAIVGMGTTLVCFITYWFLAESDWLRLFLKRRYQSLGERILYPLSQKYLGVLMLGIIPGLVIIGSLGYEPGAYFLSFANPRMTLIWSLSLGLFLILLNWLTAGRQETFEQYPQVKARIWTPLLILHNSLAWISYLLAYEFLFRGLLLYACLQVMDVWLAITVNIVIYSASHLPKGLTESLVTIPFCVVVCVLTIMSGGIWIAFFMHVCVALSNDYFSIAKHPEMRFHGKTVRLSSKDRRQDLGKSN